MVNVSIIVPVYNAEAYLSKCLDSILSSDNQNFEVCIVDDGSSDKSPDICDKYASADKRFHVIHKKNEGVSVARNTALDLVTGDYVCFVDSDDTISRDFLTVPTQFEDVDVLQKTYKCISQNDVESYEVKNQIYDNWDDIAFLWVNKPQRALWDKLIARRVIGTSRFIPGVAISEDFLFFSSIFHNIKSYALCGIGCYNYYIHGNSAMNKFYKNPRERIKITFQHIAIIESYDIEDKMHGVCMGLKYGFLVYSLWDNRMLLNEKEKKAMKDMLRLMQFKDIRYLRLRWKIEMIIVKLKSYIYG